MSPRSPACVEEEVVEGDVTVHCPDRFGPFGVCEVQGEANLRFHTESRTCNLGRMLKGNPNRRGERGETHTNTFRSCRRWGLCEHRKHSQGKEPCRR